MRSKIEFLVTLAVFLSMIALSRNISKETSAQIENKEYQIVLDAGHGGEDPGKVGINGILEKDINLEITKRVKNILEQENVHIIMTREDDSMLCEKEAGNRKREDMKRRVDLINETVPDLVVSIHQNSFTDPDVWGAQVFYCTGSEEGRRAAETIQSALIEMEGMKERQVKENDSYYLLKHTTVPTIIVECGFLSNPKEADMLKTEDYQEQIAYAVCEGILRYLRIK